MKIFFSLLLVFILGLPCLAHKGDDVKAVKIPEQSKWQFGDQVFSDPNIVNIDVVELEDGSFRAYYMYPDGIRSAISVDQGLTFTLEEGLRVSPGQHHAVLKLNDGRIRIYYSTATSAGVISSISNDGLNFTQEEGLRLALGTSNESDSASIIHPVILALADGSGYRLYYDADSKGDGSVDGWRGIRSAFSQDGLNFTKDEGFRVAKTTNVKFANLVWSPFVEYDSDDQLYKLYFSVEGSNQNKQGAFIATSQDGLDFKVIQKPIIKRDTRLGPNQAVPGGLPGLAQDLFVINVDEGKRAFYWSAGGHGIYSALLAE